MNFLNANSDSLMGVILAYELYGWTVFKKGESLLPHPDKRKERQKWVTGMYIKVKKRCNALENTFEIK